MKQQHVPCPFAHQRNFYPPVIEQLGNREKEIEREGDRKREREKEIEREGERGREREREREGERGRERERGR